MCNTVHSVALIVPSPIRTQKENSMGDHYALTDLNNALNKGSSNRGIGEKGKALLVLAALLGTGGAALHKFIKSKIGTAGRKRQYKGKKARGRRAGRSASLPPGYPIEEQVLMGLRDSLRHNTLDKQNNALNAILLLATVLGTGGAALYKNKDKIGGWLKSKVGMAGRKRQYRKR